LIIYGNSIIFVEQCSQVFRRGEKNMLGNIIGGFIVILVGTALLPTVAQQVGTAQADGNVTGAADTLVGLTTLFFALAIATSAIGIAAQGLRNSGLI
jgi:hypothetical protein